MANTTDDYGKVPEYLGTTPGNPILRQRLFGVVLVPRPQPAPAPYFTNDQPEE